MASTLGTWRPSAHCGAGSAGPARRSVSEYRRVSCVPGTVASPKRRKPRPRYSLARRRSGRASESGSTGTCHLRQVPNPRTATRASRQARRARSPRRSSEPGGAVAATWLASSGEDSEPSRAHVSLLALSNLHGGKWAALKSRTHAAASDAAPATSGSTSTSRSPRRSRMDACRSARHEKAKVLSGRGQAALTLPPAYAALPSPSAPSTS